MTLNERIKKDLTEVYNGKKIFGAKELSSFIDVSTYGLPQHFTGNRKAKTVFVMLNPGKNTNKADRERKENSDAAKSFDRNNVESFIKSYNCYLENFGKIDRKFHPIDNFDLKQAHFLKKWEESGVTLPKNFRDEKSQADAKEAVIMQKLQLELIPYCSGSFSTKTQINNLIFEYLETLFDEIFEQNRKYVIFGSRFFERVFKAYNKKERTPVIDLSVKEVRQKLTEKMSGRCKMIKINWKDKSCKAIIAYTFPSQALPNAPDLMEKYGDFCFEQYKK